MEENFIQVTRTARYHLLGNPADARSIWIVVHGYGQLARFFLNNFEGLQRHRCIVAPEGLSRFYLDSPHSRVGATWMTREDRLHEIADHVEYLDRLVERIRDKAPHGTPVHALGFSQGVATVARWALMGRTAPNHLVLWAGGLPPEMTSDQLRVWKNKHVDLVLGEKDEFAGDPALAAMAQRLAVAKVPHTIHRFAGGHSLEPVLLTRLFGA